MTTFCFTDVGLRGPTCLLSHLDTLLKRERGHRHMIATRTRLMMDGKRVSRRQHKLYASDKIWEMGEGGNVWSTTHYQGWSRLGLGCFRLGWSGLVRSAPDRDGVVESVGPAQWYQHEEGRWAVGDGEWPRLWQCGRISC